MNFNGFEDTKACLQSIEKTNRHKPFVIIVDNASNDARKLDLLRESYPYLKLIYNPENVGFGRANNIGVQWAKKNIDFNYLLLLNNDTVVEHDSLIYLEKAFSKSPDIGIVTGKIFYEARRDLVWYGGGEINYRRGWPNITDYNKTASENGANLSRYVSFVSGCCMMFTKESISNLKGFDPDFFMYSEDLELSIRAAKLGYKLYYVSKAKIYHKVQGDSSLEEKGLRAKNPNLIFLFSNMKANQYRAVRKHFRGAKMVRFWIFYHLELLLTSLKLIIAGRLDIIKPYFNIVRQTF